MQIVEFQLPPEVAADLFPDEGIRGTGNIQVLIEGLDVLSGLITVAGLRSALPVLARRIRTWRGSHPEVAEPAPALVVMAPGVRMEFPLPPNVSVQDIVEAVTKALPADADDARLMTNAPVADTSVRTYEMNLYRRYFDLVASGRKTIEVRVQYPNRRNLTAGDHIRFTCDTDEALTRVKRVAHYTSFEQMLDTEDAARVNPDSTREQQLADIRQIYGPEEEALGVLAVEIELV